SELQCARRSNDPQRRNEVHARLRSATRSLLLGRGDTLDGGPRRRTSRHRPSVVGSRKRSRAPHRAPPFLESASRRTDAHRRHAQECDRHRARVRTGHRSRRRLSTQRAGRAVCCRCGAQPPNFAFVASRMTISFDRAYAEQQDREDPLAELRAEFDIPCRKTGSPVVYLCGHSLGLQPKAARRILNEELDAWSELAVDAHFDSKRPWVSYHEQLTPSLARLAGARPSEVVAMNSLTVNLHLMLVSFYRPAGARRKILIERRAFSSDRYAVRSHVAQTGIGPAAAVIEVEPPRAEGTFHTDDICELIARDAKEIALVLLPGVQYLTGQCFDMERIAATARKHACVVGFDLAHAIGNIPLHLHDWDVDFAVWCGYKYLNGGPGAIGGCFVHERHARAFD